MADSPQSDGSRDSDDEGNEHRSKGSATKDRRCQYCAQYFTSSSLGRHLDQFLHKKKPDGVHDVEEIRKLRGGITRRTARHTKSQEQDDLPRPNSASIPNHASPPVLDQLNAIPPEGVVNTFNKFGWQTTGVINDLSGITTTALNPPKKRSYSAYAGDTTGTSDKDTARALELALREVLDSVRTATTLAAPSPAPFDFDLESQTFPSLCLTLLPQPPSLNSLSPFATPTSCPLDPPTHIHIDLLRDQLFLRVNRWKWHSLRAAHTQKYPTATFANIGEKADHLGRVAAQYEEMATRHLDLAFSTWASHPPELRTHLWQTELMRAFAKEQGRNRDLESRVETVTQEANRLQMQVEYLSRCQWPREMALWPPERVRFTKEESAHIRGINLNLDLASDGDGPGGGGGGGSSSMSPASKWDFDRLVGKWKKHVREDQSRRTGIAAAAGATTTSNTNINGTTSLPSPLVGGAAPFQQTSHPAGPAPLDVPSKSTTPGIPPTTITSTSAARNRLSSSLVPPTSTSSTPQQPASRGDYLGERRKSLRQQEQQQQRPLSPSRERQEEQRRQGEAELSYFIGSMADKTEEVRRFIQDLADTKQQMQQRQEQR